MKRYNVKWIVFFLLPICISCKTVHTELIIPDDPEAIWSVLMDETSYKDWHSVLEPFEGEDIQEGKTVKYFVKEPDGNKIEIEFTVKEMLKAKKLNQYGGIWGIMTFDHSFILEPVDGGTRLTQYEEFHGIGVLFWDGDWIKPAYDKSNQALKNRVIQLK